MRVALVHDWLNQKDGGGEAVLRALADIYPKAPIYTMIYDPARFDYPPERIHTSSLQRLPSFSKRHSRYLLPLIPSAIEGWDFSSYDVVISSSCAFTKNILTPPGTLHISYCHSPMRFAWDYWPKYLDEQGVGSLRRAMIRHLVGRLRIWDYTGSARVNHFIANSETTRHRISKYYRRESTVIYPPVPSPPLMKHTEGNYYVTLGMLTPYKKIGVVIEAFNISGLPLKIIGDGPARSDLMREAADNIEFLGRVSDDEKWRQLQGASGLVFPNLEDFGIAAVEAMAAGTPVIGYARGGVAETVSDGKTGVLFGELTPSAINAAIMHARGIEFDAKVLQKRASAFQPARFASSITSAVNRWYEDAQAG